MIEVYDKDFGSSDDFLGIVDLKIDLSRPTQMSLDLEPRPGKKDKGIKGQLHLAVEYSE